ncbi:MAG: UDP-N-acetylmuramoyl-L-alanine--D-glutamate ligase [archaeon]|nr:UDP-N-acetylmuramoyl-L-alanine--D-glutamate ligase [archaeon]
MLISVIGLGVEGESATKSFLNYGHKVYASDFSKDVKIDIDSPNLDLELGSHDFEKIYSSDAVSVSPSLFHLDVTQKIINRGLFISDVLTKHKDIKTIAVTGTNGKTTTTHMIYNILTNAGFKVAVGGNAAGGFNGYNDLLLLTNFEKEFDFILIEACDMTLEFCEYVFDIDYVVATNIGHDHLDVHKSIENYTQEVCTFIKNKVAILNSNDKNMMKIKNCPKKTLLFDKYPYNLKLFGEFNYNNADAAYKLSLAIGIDEDIINHSLQNFEAVEGRTIQFDFNNKTIVSGKTDNIDALKAVLEEKNFDVIIFGTARAGEECRFMMLDYLIEYNPLNLAIFQGLEDDLTNDYFNQLKNSGFENNLVILKNCNEIIEFIKNNDFKTIFIGGNGQQRISDIVNSLLS